MLSKPQGLVRMEGLGKLITISDLIERRDRDLPDCSALPQPLRHGVPTFQNNQGNLRSKTLDG
jgi:hypothetical protein